jgi:cytoskeletal protein CcmA (bactofilin family)
MIRTFSFVGLLGLIALSWSLPSHAFDWRSGRVISVKSGETLDDDLYAAGASIFIDGTVKGDVFAFGQTVTINGTIEGSLFTAAQSIIVNGTIKGTLRGAGNVIYLAEQAKVGRDLIGASESIELRKGSTVGRDFVYAGAEALLEGSVSRNAKIAAAGLEIKGTVGGNVTAEIGDKEDADHQRTRFMFGHSDFEIPKVPMGIAIDKDAKISGNLSYSQTKDINFPAGSVIGKITRTEPSYDRQPHNNTAHWLLHFLREMISLLIIALLLLWLIPKFLMSVTQTLRARPWPSFLWGAVAFATFIVSVIIVCLATALLAALFGVLTIKPLVATVIFGGILGEFTLILGFAFVCVFLAKILVAIAIGQWLLHQVKSPLADHRFWPMLVGVPLLTMAIAIISMPFIPEIFGGLFKFVILLFGLGALWLWARAIRSRRT